MTATNRDATLKRWATDLQNDFRARLEWCVKPPGEANHPPVAAVGGRPGKAIVHRRAAAGSTLVLSAAGSSDPDGDPLRYEWTLYREAGTYGGEPALEAGGGPDARLRVP